MDEFKIIDIPDAPLDVKFTCTRDNKIVSMDWCESNCNRYYSCQQIADANDLLVAKGY